jgi:hypothetical protein
MSPTTGSGFCGCGCGNKTNLAPYTSAPRGWVKGQPIRFLKGHSGWTKNYGPKWIVDENGCWIWQRFITTAKNRAGYGQASYGGRHGPAYRLVYEDHIGPIADGYELDHLCRVRACVNPAHMEPVPHAVNVRRGASQKVTPADIALARLRRAQGCSWRAIGRELGVKHTTISTQVARADEALRT